MNDRFLNWKHSLNLRLWRSKKKGEGGVHRVELATSLRILELESQAVASLTSTSQLHQPMNSLSYQPQLQLPRILKSLLRSPSSVRTFAMSTSAPAYDYNPGKPFAEPFYKPYKPRYIDVRPLLSPSSHSPPS
jgi:hypothetical protein